MSRDFEKNAKRRTDARDDDGENQLIYGRNAVTEALKSNRIIDLIFVNKNAGGSIGRICALAAGRRPQA
jgi:23S rRNA (guanosine2251-2'-O)-methyltransferase